MGPINECCNPLSKAKHNHVRSNIILIQKNRNAKFKNFINLYMCKPCEKAVYKLSESELNLMLKEKVDKMKKVENVSVDVCNEEVTSDPENGSDADYVDSDTEVGVKQKEQTCLKKICEIFEDLGEPPIKKRHSETLTIKDKQSIKTVLTNFIDGKKTNTVDSEDLHDTYVNTIKEALSKEETRSGKIKVLTTIPVEWSMKKIRRNFNLSRRMVSQAKSLAANSGFASEPQKKKGKKLSESTQEKVINFYLSDDISRVIPGMKDCVSVVKDGQQIRVQKRLLLFNMKDLHAQYLEKFPEAKIGLTKFQQLKPFECIAAGQSGTHNVCVCKIHQNIKLKLLGLQKEFKKHDISFVEKCDNLIKASVCEIATPACFLSTCSVCPGIQVITQRLKEKFNDNNIREITYTQWTSTDRSSYVSVLTIMMFSIERYLVVCKPLLFNTMSGMRRPLCFILTAWIISLMCALPFAIYTTINYVEYPPDSGNYSVNSAVCAMLLDHMPNFPIYELSSIVFFFMPMLVIIVLYVKMGMKIRSTFNLTKKKNLGLLHKEKQYIRCRRGVIKMLSAVVFTFFICWAPFHTQRLLYIYGQDEEYYPDMNEWLYIFSGCFYYLSTAINPLLYNFMSRRYRVAYKEILNYNIFCNANQKKNIY